MSAEDRHKGNGNGNQAQQHDNGDASSQPAQQNGAQQEQPPPAFCPPYRGIPGYYAYGGYPGVQYDPSVQDQYLYQYNYNGLHPYWSNAYRNDDDEEQWDESQ